MSQTVFVRRLMVAAAIVTSCGIGYALGAQPHMEEALVMLQSARAELARAEPNKGGHRERGLALIDQAIEQVREGIAFAAR
jgi:hypothetical protein